MSEQFEQKLREGVEAARIGDKVRARLLLQQVLSDSPDNELALMWMASVSENLDDRKYFLQRALNSNPQNDRAREALTRLGVSTSPLRTPGGRAANDADTPRRPVKTAQEYVPNLRPVERQRGLNGYLIAAGVLTVLIILVVGVTIISQALNAPTPVSAIDRTFTAVSMFIPSATRSPLPTEGPTPTIYGRIVTLDPENSNLPPAFTPTNTPGATDTPQPTPTPLPLDIYTLLFSAQSRGNLTQRLFSLVGDAESSQEIGDGEAFEDIALSADGERLAFVRLGAPDLPDEESAETTEEAEPPTETPTATAEPSAVPTLEGGIEPTVPLPLESTPEPTAIPSLDPQNAPQLYIAERSDPGDATALTRMRGLALADPSWSPDGRTLVFASDQDGDRELYRISAEGGSPIQLTFNDALDDSPSYSPDGAQLVYTSDDGSPDFTEIYTLELETGEPTRLTEAAGSSFDPVYSPNGDSIAFVSDRGGDDNDIYVMGADGSGAFLLTIDDDGAEDRSPAWSPDGRFIAFASNREDGVFAWYLVEVSAMPSGEVTRLASGDGVIPDTILFAP